MPDIPNTPVAGQMVETFGRQVQQFGNTLLNLTDTANQVGKALYNGAVSQEVTAAKRLAYTRLNEFNYKILNGENTDYRSYLDAWNAYQTETLAQATSRMTLQEAKDEFSEFWTGAAQSNAAWLTEKAAGGLVAEAEVTAKTALVEAARHGNEAAVMDYVKENVRRGVWTGAEGSELAAQYIPQARYNNALNMLDALGDPDAAAQILSDPKADEQFNLPTTGSLSIESARKFFEEKGASNRDRANRQRVATAQEVYTSILPKWDDGSVTSDELRAALGKTVGTPYETGIKGMLDKRNAVYGQGADVIKQREQLTEFYTLQNSLYEWRRNGGQGEPPWTVDTLLQKFGATKLAKEQVDSLTEQWQKADEPDNVVDYRSRISRYVLQTGKLAPLQWLGLESEITAEYNKGNLTKEEHKSLLGDLQSAQAEYNKRLNVTEDKYEFDASGIIYNPKMSEADKQKWLQDNKAHFSGDDYAKWWGRISPYNNDPDRQSVLNALSDFYGRAAAGPDVTETRKRELSIEEYYAKEAMQNIFTQYPEKGDRPKWDEALNSMLSDRSMQDLEDAIEKQLGAVYTATFGTPDFRNLDVLAAGQETGLLATNAALRARFAVRSSDIREREQQLVIAKVRGVNVTKTSTTADGETLFYDESKNTVYYVETARIGGKLRRTVYSSPVGGTQWSVVGSE